MLPHVLILGAGVGGLAAAIRLAARGVRVTIVEQGPRVGGKLNFWEAPHPHRPHDRPFRFDTGPSLLTLPFVFKDLFEAAGEDVRDHLPIQKLDPISRFVWADGQQLELHSDERAMRDAIAAFAPSDVQGWTRFFERGRRIWDTAGEFFLHHAPEQIFASSEHRLLDGLRLATIPFRIGMLRTYASVVDAHIRHARLREVLYQYATYSGSSPYLAPSTLNVIPFVELHYGAWSIRGGMYQLARSLESVARKLGVEILLNVRATRILLSDSTLRRSRWSPRRKVKARTVRALQLDPRGELDCDALICNADVPWSYRHLLDEADRPHFSDTKLDQLEPGSSGMALLLGIDGVYPQLAHHNKFMSANPRSELHAMFETHTIPADPCIYVCASTRTDPTLAPDGCENLFILASASPLDGALDWTVEGERYERQVIDTLERRFGLTDLSRRIVVRQRLTPQDLATRYNAHRGSIYGISSNGLRAAFLRPPNRDKQIAGLYFAGGATHPGGGLPLVALSGKIAAELVCEDLKVTKPLPSAEL